MAWPRCPTPEFLDELAHELKDQFASNSDLRDESELFYEFQSRVSHNYRELDARIDHYQRRVVLRRAPDSP